MRRLSTADTEVNGRYKICGAGLCSMQGSIVQGEVTRRGHTSCVHICIYIEQSLEGRQNIWGGLQGSISSTSSANILN